MRKQIVQTLYQTVSEFDGASPKIYWHMLDEDRENPWNFWLFDEDKLITFFAAYAFDPGQIEITGMVHPNYRREGVFRNFFEGFVRRNPQFKQFVFAGADCVVTQVVMEKLGAAFSYVEAELIRGGKNKPPSLRGGDEVVDAAIHQAKPADLLTVISLDASCFGTNPNDIKAQFKSMLHDPMREVYLFYLKDQAIGKVHVRFDSLPGSAYLHDICILPQYQNQGFGMLMLQQLLAQLAEKQCERVSVEVLEQNKAALSLYRKIGFDVVHRYQYYTLNDYHPAAWGSNPQS